MLLAMAILCALPWSLALLLLDFGHGFANQAGAVVCVGLVVNAALLWWCTAALRTRMLQREAPERRRHDP